MTLNIFQELNKICQRTRIKNMNLAILHRSCQE